jgi:hypothetical protein
MTPHSNEPLVFAFALSRHADGKVSSWLHDNAVGAIVAPSVADAKDAVLRSVQPGLDFKVCWQEFRPLRLHLINEATGTVVGVLSGFKLRELAERGAITKYRGEADHAR